MGIDYNQLKARKKQLADSHGGNSEFLRFKAGESYQFRPVDFIPRQGEREVFDRETGNHFGLVNYGAREVYQENGVTKSRNMDGIRCAAVTHGQYADPALARLLDELGRDRGRICSEEEQELLGRHCIFCKIAEGLRASDNSASRKQGNNERVGRKYMVNGVLRTADKPQGRYVLAELPKGLYEEILGYLTDDRYAGRFFSSMGREFEIKVSGERLEREYELKVLPDDYPLGAPEGKVVNLYDPDWAEHVLRCWSLADQRTICSGGTVTRPQKADKEAPKGPPPVCFKSDRRDPAHPGCAQCNFLRACGGEEEPSRDAAPSADVLVLARRLGLGKPAAPATVPVAAPAPAEPPKVTVVKPAAPAAPPPPVPAPLVEAILEPPADPAVVAAAPEAASLSIADRLKRRRAVK
jgi:hypothetical protein